MRNFIFAAIVAVFAALPGRVEATSISNLKLEHVESVKQVDPATAAKVIEHLEQCYGFDYQCLCEQYRTGQMQINKRHEGYDVAFQSSNGGVIISIIENI